MGCDIVEVQRLAGSYQRHQQAFLQRVYTPAEQTYCLQFTHAAERLAGRWCAKEACMKALGRGISQGISFTDIEIYNDSFGAPQLRLHGAAEIRAQELHATRWWCTISHTAEYATATVILESCP